MNKINFILFTFLILHVSCSSSKLIISPDFKEYDNTGKTMTVVLGNNIFINYSGNVEPEFGKGNENELILNFFKKQLAEDIKALSFVEECTVIEKKPRFRRIKKEFKKIGWILIFPVVEKDTLVLPDNNQDIYIGSTPSDYILFIDDLNIGTSYSSTYSGMGHSTNSKDLGYSSKICLWDCNEKKVISYGKASEKSSGTFGFITMSTWIDVSYRYVRRILKKTPLKKTVNIRELSYENTRYYQ